MRLLRRRGRGFAFRPRYAGGSTRTIRHREHGRRAPGPLDAVHYSYGDGPTCSAAVAPFIRGGSSPRRAEWQRQDDAREDRCGAAQPDHGLVTRIGRATYLSQDPGRYLVCETALGRSRSALAETSGGRGGARRGSVSRSRRPPPTRPLERGARATRHRRRLGLRARSARARRADARDRPRSQGGARRLAARRRPSEGRGILVATHDPLLPAHRRVRLGCAVGGSRCGLGSLSSHSSRSGLRAWSGPRSTRRTAASRRCSPRSRSSPEDSPGSSRAATLPATSRSWRRSEASPPRDGCSSRRSRACSP